jgi:hypothetical protein
MSSRSTQDLPALGIELVVPHRLAFVVLESVVLLGGLVGTIQLLFGIATPPASAIEPLGLTNWVLPAAWLFLPSSFLRRQLLRWPGVAPRRHPVLSWLPATAS